jgi:hypothetical protein
LKAGVGLWVLALVLGGLGAGCTVGTGEGSAGGVLYLKNCYGSDADDSYGTFEMPRDFSLNANFFAGEPIEDIKPNGSDNRLLIRMQGSGTRIEDSDLLVFDMDSWRVAQCVHGDPAVLATEELKRFCSRDAGSTTSKLRIGPGLPVRVNLALRKRCPGNPYAVATARDTSIALPDSTPADWTSYIRLKAFGDAARGPVLPTFKVEFGQMLEAEAFVLDMLDDRNVRYDDAVKTPATPAPPEPMIKASVAGNFKFELQRGQGAQTFP